MEVGDFAEAWRAHGRVVEERAAKVGTESVDEDLLGCLVDAATSTPPDESGNTTIRPNEGQGLLRGVEVLFEHHPSPHLFPTYLPGTRASICVARQIVRGTGRLPR